MNRLIHTKQLQTNNNKLITQCNTIII